MEKECCNHRCPVSVYFHTLLLSIYLSATETLTCRREMSLIGSTYFGIELIVALSPKNAAKIVFFF